MDLSVATDVLPTPGYATVPSTAVAPLPVDPADAARRTADRKLQIAVRPSAPTWVHLAAPTPNGTPWELLFYGAFPVVTIVGAVALLTLLGVPGLFALFGGVAAGFGEAILTERLVSRHQFPVLASEATALRTAVRARSRVEELSLAPELSDVLPATLLPELTVHLERGTALLEDLGSLRSHLERATGSGTEVGLDVSDRPALASLLAQIESVRSEAIAELFYVTSCRREVEELFLRLAASPSWSTPADLSEVVDPLERLRCLNRAAAEITMLDVR